MAFFGQYILCTLYKRYQNQKCGVIEPRTPYNTINTIILTVCSRSAGEAGPCARTSNRPLPKLIPFGTPNRTSTRPAWLHKAPVELGTTPKAACPPVVELNDIDPSDLPCWQTFSWRIKERACRALAIALVRLLPIDHIQAIADEQDTMGRLTRVPVSRSRQGEAHGLFQIATDP